MYTINAQTKEAYEAPQREFKFKVEYGNTTFTGSDIETFSIERTLTEDEVPLIGSCNSAKLIINFLYNKERTNIPSVFVPTEGIKPYIGIVIGTATQWLQLGEFYADNNSITKTDFGIELTCYDAMIQYAAMTIKSADFNNLTINQAIPVIESKLGQSISGSFSQNITLAGLTDSITYRQLLGEIAILSGGNFVIDNLGGLKLVNYTSTKCYTFNKDGGYYDTIEWYNYEPCTISTIGNVERGTDENSQPKEDIYYTKSGATPGAVMTFTLPNNADTQEKLAEIYDRAGFPLTFYAFSIEAAGLPFLEVGDLVGVPYHKDGLTYDLVITSHILTCGTGVNSTISCQPIEDGAALVSNNYNAGASLSGAVGSAFSYSCAGVVDEYLNGKFNSIAANKADIDLANIKQASIKTAMIDDAQITRAKIAEAAVGEAQLGVASVGTMHVQDGSIQTAHIQDGAIDTVKIKDEAVDNSKIKNLVANKITSGTINTSSVSIESEDGNMKLNGTTMQIKDSNGIVRVQIGKDGTNDYNIWVWDASGNVMFNSNGITADGIKDAIIVDDMVSENANIKGSKIDIVSLVEEINNGEKTINSSQIQYDGESLNVKFEEVIETQDKQTEAMTTLRQDVDGIVAKVESEYATKDEVVELSSRIDQNAESIQLTFQEAKQYTDDTTAGVKETVETMSTYIRATSEGLEIGKSDSPFVSKFDNQELGFYYGGNRVAYISDDSLHVPNNAEVGELTITNANNVTNQFIWRIREDGHCSLITGENSNRT